MLPFNVNKLVILSPSKNYQFTLIHQTSHHIQKMLMLRQSYTVSPGMISNNSGLGYSTTQYLKLSGSYYIVITASAVYPFTCFIDYSYKYITNMYLCSQTYFTMYLMYICSCPLQSWTYQMRICIVNLQVDPLKTRGWHILTIYNTILAIYDII